MRLDRLTVKSQEAIQEAQTLAERKGNQQMEVEHLLYAILGDNDGIGQQILGRIGLNINSVRSELEKEIEKFPKVSGSAPLGQIYVGPRLQSVLGKAFDEAQHLTDEFISIEHILVAIFSDSGPATETMKRSGATREKVLAAMREIRGVHRVTDPNPEEKYQALKKYGKDLTDLARKGKLDPVIGRDEEIRRVIQVLSRRTKNNPVLIGDPGVGKTAIVEGLAQRMIAGDVPETLRQKSLITLDLGSLVAGS